MLQVLGCLFQQHDLRLVAASLALCFFACATALVMIARARAASVHHVRLAWIASAGMVAGCGIWATHFVAMLAFTISLPVAFHTGLTILSAVVAILFCSAGFALAIGRFGGAAGGLLAGAAVCAMHYIGMAALDLPAQAIWDIRYVAASALIGLSFAGLAMHFAMRRQGILDTVKCAGLFAFAVIGMHFTAMSAVRFVPDPTVLVSDSTIDPFILGIVIATGATLIVSQGLMIAIFDYRFSARAQAETLRMRKHIAELENTKEALSVALASEASANHAKSAFLASMSHELRTPLNAVIGFSEMMLAEIFGPMAERYRDYTKDIHASGAHLLSLINDILDVSRLDAGEGELREEEFDLSDVIGESLRLVSAQAEKARVPISANFGPDLPRLHADKRRIKQVILNILSNALKFSPADGRVNIWATLVPDGLAIAIRDNGIGIAAADMAKVFERFGQVDSTFARKYDGTGLGLPLARRLVELHGGNLILESILNRGTTVTINLPVWRLVPQDRKLATAWSG